MSENLLAVIHARSGSRCVAGKNIKPVAAQPLIAHTVLMAKRCPEITRCIVSTDSVEIAEVARSYGADIPFMRPPELAQDDTPLWPVLRHALEKMEPSEGQRYDFLMSMDPTSPGRLPEDITGAFNHLLSTPEADGIIGVSEPEFNPIWTCVVERDGWMADLIEGGGKHTRRQDVPNVYRINALLYMWRTGFVRRNPGSWRLNAKNLLYKIPEFRAIHIDLPEQFERADLLLRSGLVQFPWLDRSNEAQTN